MENPLFYTPKVEPLTREQILALPAGRELDGLVAEHIMGFLRTYYREHYVYESPEHQAATPTEQLTFRNGLYSLGGVIVGMESPRIVDYSLQIRYAWTVLEAMQSRLFSKREHFTREIDSLIKSRLGIRISWPNALFHLKPEDICKAALLAHFSV